MPTKLNKAGNQQNYVPAGNGDASGEYGDNADGSNKHYFAHFKKQVDGEIIGIKEPSKSSQASNDVETLADEVDKDFDKYLDKYLEEHKDEIVIGDKTSLPKEEEQTKLSVDTDKKKTKTTSQKKVAKYTDEDCYDFLLTQYHGEFDEEKIKTLNSEELHNLVLAKYEIENNSIQKGVQKKYKKLTKFVNDPENGLNNIWNNFPKTPEDLEQSLEKKKLYYENSFNSPYIDDDTKAINKEKLDKVNNFQELTGKLYSDWNNAYLESGDLEQFNQDLVDKFYKFENPYTQSAKDNAYWYKSFNESYKALEPSTTKLIKELDNENPDIVKSIKKYTGSFSYINEPLRKIPYFGDKAVANDFIKSVKNMTAGIDKSISKHNMWLQRGVSKLDINGKILNYGSANDDVLNSLVGATFEDQGFVSCGSAKGTGMVAHDVIMNIYAPKGTKMMYVAPISQYKNENETIIQRGYSYKITKAERKNGKVYLDCEVVLGSDSKKYNANELQELANKYFQK